MLVWALPISMPITQLRSIAPSHRRHLIDVTDMDMKAIQQLLSNLVKLGNGLGLLLKCFTQPPHMLTVSIKTDLTVGEVHKGHITWTKFCGRGR